MIECLLTGANGIMERVDAPCPGCWINAVAPTPEERAWLDLRA